MLQNFKGWEIIIILAVILLLFGAKRLPDAARGLGRSMRIFKSEIKAAQDDGDFSFSFELWSILSWASRRAMTGSPFF